MLEQAFGQVATGVSGEPANQIARRAGVDALIRHDHDRAAALAHEALERTGVGRRQAIETADDHDVEGVEAGIAERQPRRRPAREMPRDVELRRGDLEPRIRLERAPEERRRPRRARIVELDAKRRAAESTTTSAAVRLKPDTTIGSAVRLGPDATVVR